MLFDEKKGGEKVFSIWWFFIIGLVAVVIAIGVYVYASAEADARAVEADILGDKIKECILDSGFLKKDVLNEGFDVFEECGINKGLFEGESDFYFRISFLQENPSLTGYSSKDNKWLEITGIASLKKVINYARENSIRERKCSCNSDEKCNSYAEYIFKAAAENGIPDPLLLLSIMMQESGCIETAFSGSSTGLMQINLIHCGNFGLPTDREKCMQELIENPEKNIAIGAKILKKSYDKYKNGRKFSGACTDEYKERFYSGWDAAVRGYNGWGCGEDSNGNKIVKQDFYVEEVMERHQKMKEVAGGGISESPEAVSKIRGDVKGGNLLFEKECMIAESDSIRTDSFPKCTMKREPVLYYDSGSKEVKRAIIEILIASNNYGKRVSVLK